MILWRISEFATLDGLGGLRVPGRWHSQGRPIVYCAGSAALAMLETLVHLEVATVPPAFQLLRIEAPDDLAVTEWPGPASADAARTAAWGDRWLRDAATPLARVPSILSPGDRNWLVNPLHPRAATIRIAAHSRHPWDRRLFR